MDKREMANRLIEEFGSMLTVEDLKLDEENNSCVLLFDENIVLNVEYDPTDARLVFSVYLDEIPQQNSEPLLRQLHASNLYWSLTCGATLALEEASGGIILAYARPVDDIDASKLEAIVQNILDQAEKWRARIARHKEADTAGASNADAAVASEPSGGRIIFG